MTRWRSFVAAAMAVGVVAGCSSSASEGSDEPSPSTQHKQKQKNTAGPVEVKGGTAAPGSLSDFRCEPNGDGRWVASGTLTNNERNDADFRVTVVVAPPGTPSATARQITVPDVPDGKSKTFSSKRLPVTDGDGPVCSVQVARLR